MTRSNAAIYARERQCAGKRHYRSKVRAKLALRRMSGPRAGIHPYRCIYCGGFHLGHKPKKEAA